MLLTVPNLNHPQSKLYRLHSNRTDAVAAIWAEFPVFTFHATNNSQVLLLTGLGGVAYKLICLTLPHGAAHEAVRHQEGPETPPDLRVAHGRGGSALSL